MRRFFPCLNLVFLSVLIASISGCGGEKRDEGSNSGSKTTNGTAAGGGGYFVKSKPIDRNKGKQLALAIHNYLAVYRKFPFSPKQSELLHKDLSWRVQLLPFLEQVPAFDKFNKEKPADDPGNTAVAAPIDSFTLSNGSVFSRVTTGKPIDGLRNILDGSSNTVMLIENPKLPPEKWSHNIDMTVDEAVKLIRSLKKGESLIVVLYDGSSFRMGSTEGKNITDDQIRAAFVPDDGIQLDIQELFE